MGNFLLPHMPDLQSEYMHLVWLCAVCCVLWVFFFFFFMMPAILEQRVSIEDLQSAVGERRERLSMVVEEVASRERDWKRNHIRLRLQLDRMCVSAALSWSITTRIAPMSLGGPSALTHYFLPNCFVQRHLKCG